MEQRLGQNGIDDFRNHPFFEGIDWDNLADSKLSIRCQVVRLAKCSLITIYYQVPLCNKTVFCLPCLTSDFDCFILLLFFNTLILNDSKISVDNIWRIHVAFRSCYSCTSCNP